MGRKQPDWVRKIFEMLVSDNADRRRDGWEEVRRRGIELQIELEPAQRTYLIDLLHAERDETVRWTACLALLSLSLITRPEAGMSHVRVGKKDRAGSDKSLGNWLWDPFRQTSAVFGVTATDFRRRDECALQWLGRRLSFKDYPAISFPQVSLQSCNFLELLFQGTFQAICLVGRPGLFGGDALKRFRDGELRFGFAKDHRPQNLPTGQLDSEYHCILETLSPGNVIRYATVEEQGYRTDYVTVQRYPVVFRNGQILVVIIAGGSTLGTLAGARWAAYDLFQVADPTRGLPIGLPTGSRLDSRMEALLRVRARVTTQTWDGLEIDLHSLYFDKQCWSKLKWNDLGPRHITLVRRRRKPDQLLFDGTPRKFNPGRCTYRLLLSLVDAALQKKPVRITDLAANKSIWLDSNVHVTRVRGNLKTLKHRHLKDALVWDDQSAYLTATVTLDDQKA